MGRQAFGRQGAASRRQRGVGLDQLLVKCEERNLIGPKRRHWRLLRDRCRLHGCGQNDRAEKALVHYYFPTAASDRKAIFQFSYARSSGAMCADSGRLPRTGTKGVAVLASIPIYIARAVEFDRKTTHSSTERQAQAEWARPTRSTRRLHGACPLL